MKNILKKMVQITSGFSKEGYQVILASSAEKKEIWMQCRKLKIDQNSRRILPYLITMEQIVKQLLEEMSRSIYIIATRFHGTILGLAIGKSVFPILYSDKTKYVLEDLGFHGEYADLRDPDSLSFENAKKNLESGYKIDVTESIQNAEKHFEKLDEFLNN